MPNFVYSDGAAVQPAKQTSRGQPLPSTGARPTVLGRGAAKGKGRTVPEPRGPNGEADPANHSSPQGQGCTALGSPYKC